MRFAALVLAATAVAATVSFSARAQMPVPVAGQLLPPLVSVTGIGEIKVVPDQVMLRMGVETRADKLEDAKRDNDAKMKAMLAVLKQKGIEAKDVQTDYLSIQPQYPMDAPGNVRIQPIGYSVRRNATVLLRKVDKFDDVLSSLIASGSNTVDNIDFRTSKLEEYRQQARLLAIRAAKEKATTLTGAVGSKLGRAYSINEENNVYQPVMYNKMMAMSDAGGESGPTISPGEITVTTTVQASFVME
ncbi:MAG: SIMPL domain-containing protein [Hymenobacteraceae bacterium]|nr:SIMPL domain-containing protein [Hymenobacteraceae bacterium]